MEGVRAIRYSGQIAPFLPRTAPLALRIPQAVYDTDPIGPTSTGPGLTLAMGDVDPPSVNYLRANPGRPSRWGNRYSATGGLFDFLKPRPSICPAPVVCAKPPPCPPRVACACPVTVTSPPVFPGYGGGLTPIPIPIPAIPKKSPIVGVPLSGFDAGSFAMGAIVGYVALGYLLKGLWK